VFVLVSRSIRNLPIANFLEERDAIHSTDSFHPSPPFFSAMSRVPSKDDLARQELEEVVKTSTHKRLRTVLLETCNESPEAFKLVHDKLFVKEEQVGRPAVSLLDGPLADNSAFKLPRAQKRGRRYDVCEQCETEFDILKEEKCVWHPGKKIATIKPHRCITHIYTRRLGGV